MSGTIPALNLASLRAPQRRSSDPGGCLLFTHTPLERDFMDTEMLSGKMCFKAFFKWWKLMNYKNEIAIFLCEHLLSKNLQWLRCKLSSVLFYYNAKNLSRKNSFSSTEEHSPKKSFNAAVQPIDFSTGAPFKRNTRRRRELVLRPFKPAGREKVVFPFS